MNLPSGTVTFLFTDIEGSTKLWEAYPDAMRQALARHDELLRQAIEDNNGYVFKTVGDSFCAAFATAPAALAAAVQSHLLLLNEEWGETGSLRVRMGLHTGEAQERDGDYFGQTLNRVARLQGIGHGQQTLLSQTTYQLVCNSLPPDVTLQDMGQHRLKDLFAPEHVWQLLHPAFPSEFPPLKSLDYLPTNLPRQMTSFIGREREMQEVKRLLPLTPLLTLVGSGGAGKTRLAVQVGAEVLDDYKDGVWLVELAALADPALIPQAVAGVLGLREEAGRSLLQTIQDYLRDRELLLLLDNCEHLLSACALLADTLLTTCSHLSILATSREPFGIAGERAWRVPSLLTPEPKDLPLEEKEIAVVLMEYDACRLFVERATVQRQDFVLTRRNAPIVASLCQQLDGIPLAIELAAARVRSLSVEEINSKLDNRFRLLTGGNRTALPRHQTLRALIDWSYDLLTGQEKTLLCRLAVFAGGWTLAGAEQVGAGESSGGEGIEDWEVLNILTSLADKSLVVAEQQEEHSRYRLLETVRQYARDRLSESGESLLVRARHANYFLMLAEEAKSKLMGPEQAQWLEVLEQEHDNLRAALTFSLEEEEAQAGLQLAERLWRFWQTRGHLNEGRERLAAILAHPAAQEPTRARASALNAAGVLARDQGDFAAVRTFYAQSREIYERLEDRQGVADALGNLGNAAEGQGDYPQARALYEEALVLYRGLGNRNGEAIYLNNMGLVVLHQGDYTTARMLLMQSLAIRQELGDTVGIAMTLDNLGNVAFLEGNLAAAQELYVQTLEMRRALENKPGLATSMGNLGNVAERRGDFAQARALYEEALVLNRELGNRAWEAILLQSLGNMDRTEGKDASARLLYNQSLRMFQEIGDIRGIAESFEAFASLACKAQNSRRAACLWGAAAALRETISYPRSPADREQQEREMMAARKSSGADAFAAAWAQGQEMTMEQAIEYALSEPDVTSS